MIIKILSPINSFLALLAFVAAFPVIAISAESGTEQPRKIYAHYMGCFPAGSGPTFHHQFKDKAEREGFRHDSKGVEARKGGRFKTWPLVPELEKSLTSEESADLEIRRAIRAGIDGFAIDAWAGGQSAKDTLDALFVAAEAGKYPFEITICLDPWCMDGAKKLDAYKEAVTYLLEKHRDSPNLARRDGKPLILTYQGQGILAGMGAPSLATPEGWDALINAYQEVEKAAGEPLYFYFDFVELLLGQSVPPGKTATAAILESVPKLAGYFDAIGNLFDLNGLARNKAFMMEMSEVVRASGAEWAPAVWYQYHNIGWNTETVSGTSKLRETWERAMKQNATLIQFATWNDYGEHTSLAPTRATNYGITGINRYYSDWWKTGKPPAIKEDQVFLTHRTSRPIKAFPFSGNSGGSKTLEVLTLLTAPGKIKVGSEEKEVPTGLSISEFSAPLGQVQVELLRNGQVVETLKSREHITDKPFRNDPTLYSVSTSDAKSWEEDFPGAEYPPDDFYGDADGDGLPNWFEMYWFGTWRDFSTATTADPHADPDGDGKTNLEEYSERADPTAKPVTYEVGFVWDMKEVLERNGNFNPQKDSKGTEVWNYLWKEAEPNAELTPDIAYKPMVYPHERLIGYYGDGRSHVEITWQKKKDNDHPNLLFKPWTYRPSHPKYGTVRVALSWTSPVKGTVELTVRMAEQSLASGSHSVATFSIEDSENKVLYSINRVDKTAAEMFTLPVKVAHGEQLYFVAEGNQGIRLEDLRVTLKDQVAH